MPIQLLVISGPDKGRCFTIADGNKLTLGRGDQSDTKLDDAAVSRVHCEIARHADTLTLKDLNSSSGTFLDDRQIDIAEIKIGSLIRLGDTTIELQRPSQPGEETAIGPAHQPHARPLDELVGKTIGSYEIQSIIGQGVSGMIFKSFDREKARTAAVKVLTPHFSRSEEQRQRFVRAMKSMLPIKDPYIVGLYNAGITGPYCWAAMEFIEGENLAQLIARIGIDHMLDWKEVWHVAMNIGQALKTGYEHKVIHRNLTPTNILRRSSDNVCLLGDFMLAKAIEGKLAQQVTQPGQIVGDLAYLPPERTLPEAEVDTRSDLYGLGATCYALLTGRPPAEGRSLPEIINNVRNTVPPPPKQFQLSINDLFQDVIMQLLEKNPARRFEHPAHLLGELVRVGKYTGLEIA